MGGTLNTGGAGATGGRSNLGGTANTGGVANTGGAATGGSPATGGSLSISATTGGSPATGGAATGGAATGGEATGGAATGGSPTGGAATGGAGTGGDATGGAGPCNTGDICTPTNSCHVWTVDCTSGSAVCTDTGQFFLRKTAFKGNLSHFVMELPPYRLPSMKTVVRITWVQVRSFLNRAGTLIFAASVAIWVLLNTPPGLKNPADSAAAYVGKAITPIFKPIGINDWRISTSLIPAFLAREIVLSSMGTIYSENIPTVTTNFHFFPALGAQAKSLGIAVKESFTSLLTPTIQTLKADNGYDSLRAMIRSSFTQLLRCHL